MIHARLDYQRIQDPENLIPVNEPVMLFRAKDRLAPMVLERYRELLVIVGAEAHMIEAVNRHIILMRQWQIENGTKTPDMDKEALR